jgi:hypothetical protein
MSQPPPRHSQLLLGSVSPDVLAEIMKKLPAGATQVGAVTLVTLGDGQDNAPPQQITSDIYVGDDQHTHVVIGVVTPDGTWEILSDTTVPF